MFGVLESEIEVVIPSFVLKQWNFQKFPISKEALNLIKNWYDKPVIMFRSDDPLIKSSSMLKQALIYKRKIHKIFDLIKCKDFEEIAKRTLKDYSYLVLKENDIAVFTKIN